MAKYYLERDNYFSKQKPFGLKSSPFYRVTEDVAKECARLEAANAAYLCEVITESIVTFYNSPSYRIYKNTSGNLSFSIAGAVYKDGGIFKFKNGRPNPIFADELDKTGVIHIEQESSRGNIRFGQGWKFRGSRYYGDLEAYDAVMNFVPKQSGFVALMVMAMPYAEISTPNNPIPRYKGLIEAFEKIMRRGIMGRYTVLQTRVGRFAY